MHAPQIRDQYEMLKYLTDFNENRTTLKKNLTSIDTYFIISQRSQMFAIGITQIANTNRYSHLAHIFVIILISSA